MRDESRVAHTPDRGRRIGLSFPPQLWIRCGERVRVHSVILSKVLNLPKTGTDQDHHKRFRNLTMWQRSLCDVCFHVHCMYVAVACSCFRALCCIVLCACSAVLLCVPYSSMLRCDGCACVFALELGLKRLRVWHAQVSCISSTAEDQLRCH